MHTYEVEASAVVEAPPARVYALISDYHAGHPAILPARYFTKLEVVEGGVGAGTVVRAHMNVLGTQALFNLTVSEPEPGRVLQEEDSAAGVVTTFTVDAVNAGAQSRVTIHTRARTEAGLKGWLTKSVNAVLTRRIYRAELAQLQALMLEEAAARAATAPPLPN